MSIPDLPTPPEITGQASSGLKYHILGTVQQVLAVELQPGKTIFSYSGAMSWMSASVNCAVMMTIAGLILNAGIMQGILTLVPGMAETG